MGEKLLLVGCGRMGGALLHRWISGGVAQSGDITVIEPNEAAAQEIAAMGVDVFDSPDEILSKSPPAPPALVLFAVKPQIMDVVVPVYAPFAAGGSIMFSIAAGKPAGYFEGLLGADAAIVRAMPNTPAQIGRGITALYGTPSVKDAGKALCQRLMAAVGDVVWLADESLMDAVTALSGSGPAYVFYMIECLAAAGQKAGLAPDLADQLARATVAGAGELALQSEEPAGDLRVQVTSPGGTTAAALAVLMADDGLQSLMIRAVAAAKKRSIELAK